MSGRRNDERSGARAGAFRLVEAAGHGLARHLTDNPEGTAWCARANEVAAELARGRGTRTVSLDDLADEIRSLQTSLGAVQAEAVRLQDERQFAAAAVALEYLARAEALLISP